LVFDAGVRVVVYYETRGAACYDCCALTTGLVEEVEDPLIHHSAVLA